MPKDFDIPKMMENGEFEPLLPNNKRQDVKISGEYNFSNSALSNTRNITLKKRGRPVSIPDKRNKVSVPKKISPRQQVAFYHQKATRTRVNGTLRALVLVAFR